MNCVKIWDYLQQTVRQQVKKTNKSGVVVGISGGIDSAMTTVLAIEALGTNNVRGLLLPYYHNEHFTDAYNLTCQFLLREHVETIWINKIVNEAIQLDIGSTDLTKGNLLARLRMIILYDRALMHNCLVMGTCNKSEIMTGYLTKYGDGASDFEPLGDILKTDLYTLAHWYNETHIPGIPECILTKAPSADLIEGQKDEDDLGPYTKLDNILRYYLGQCNYFPPQTTEIDKVLSLIKSSEHKRKMPQIPQIPDEWLILDGSTPMNLDEFRDTIINYIDTFDDAQFKSFVRTLLPIIRK